MIPRTNVRIDGIAEPDGWSGFDYVDYYLGAIPSRRRFEPNKPEAELRESLREAGIVTCTCRGWDRDDGKRMIVIDPTCPVHNDRCFACGKTR